MKSEYTSSRSLSSLLLVSVVFLGGCTREPPTTKKSSQNGTDAKTQGSSYDPKKDPLVNPSSLFESYPQDHPETVAEDETLVRVLDGNPSILTPIFMSSTFEFHTADLLFDGLFSFDADMNWFVNKEVVESAEDSEDHLVTTVRMRSGLKWHDGQPWTAHDVRFSWEVISDDSVPCPAVKVGTDQIKDVKVIDDQTFQFVHKKALPTNKWNMMFPIIPRHIYGNPEERAKDPTLSTSEYYNRHGREAVVGSGPYRLVKWITNDRIVMERWEEFHGEKPHFKRQILKIQPDSNVALLLFKRGETDEMRLSSQQFATQTNDAEFSKVGFKAYSPQWAFQYIGWNMDGTNPFFTDRRVRHAMAHALNIPELIEKIEYNLVTRCHGIYHPDSSMYNPKIELIEYDLDAAAKLLDEAGWKTSDDDGWRYKQIGGKPVKFEFTMLIPQGASNSPKIAAFFAQDLKKIGVSLETRTNEWATFLERVHKHEFQASIAAWGTGTDPDTGWNLWRSEQYKNGRNYGGYKNERVDKLFELARSEFDQDKRASYYQEIQKLVYDDQPYLFLWNRGTMWAFHRRLRGIRFSPRGVYNFDPSHKAWWVPNAEKLR